MVKYEMKIILEIRGDRDALLRGYSSLHELLEKLVKAGETSIDVSEPRESSIEIPPKVTAWFLQRKGKFSGKEIALAILNLRHPNALAKSEIEQEAEQIGVNVGRFKGWLNKTFMSPHGPMKGLVAFTQDSRTRLYTLTPFGRARASELMKKMTEEYLHGEL